jgi:hypothetical protein
VPYSPVNINEIYAKGGTLEDIYQSPFFKDLRDWQIEMKAKTSASNLMNPCPIRDHHADLRRMIAKHEPDPIDINAAQALQDPDYAKGMDAYDAAYQKIVDEVWQKAYIKQQKLSQEELMHLIEKIKQDETLVVE